MYCNCDDARDSNFFRYFTINFEHLGLKKVIATGYKKDGRGVCLVYEGDRNGNRRVDDEEIAVTELRGNGDFRSEECEAFLRQADVVVTNPPFSLFREYVAQLMEFGKKFLIIGNMNAITYKEIFPLIKENKLWLGCSIHSGDREFRVPDDTVLKGSNWRIDENGVKYARVPGVRWFTNVPHTQRHTPLTLYKKYNPQEFPKYDNYDAIEVSKTADIPMDYDGVMGVPISFLDKYCPEQFEIVGFRKGEDGKDLVFSLESEKYYPYYRMLIRQSLNGSILLSAMEARHHMEKSTPCAESTGTTCTTESLLRTELDKLLPVKSEGNTTGGPRNELASVDGKYVYKRIFIRNKNPNLT